jgi:YidC/Oxa1 family membrane protein insertase
MSALSQLVGWVLAGFYSLIPNYGVAIILLGLAFMALVAPLTLKSTRSMLAMQKLQPKMKQLQQQHKNDRLALNQALTQLYKDEGVSPFGACLPTLLPLPLFYILYRVITGLANKPCTGKGKLKVCRPEPLYIGHNTRMYHDLVHSGGQIFAFGINLAKSAGDAVTQHLGAGEIFGSLLLLLIMIAANFYQQVQITNLNPMVRQNQQMNSQMRIMRFFPIIFGLVCIRLPSGLVLYYAISALFRVGQQWLMYKFDPKVKALVARDDRDMDVLEARLEEQERKPAKNALPPARTDGGTRSSTKPGSSARPNAARPRPSSATRAKAPPRADASGNGQLNGKQPSRYPSGSGNAQRARNRKRRGK